MLAELPEAVKSWWVDNLWQMLEDVPGATKVFKDLYGSRDEYERTYHEEADTMREVLKYLPDLYSLKNDISRVKWMITKHKPYEYHVFLQRSYDEIVSVKCGMNPMYVKQMLEGQHPDIEHYIVESVV